MGFDVVTVRKSRRIGAFLMLSGSKVEEVSQNGFVFKLAAGQIEDRQRDGKMDRQIDRRFRREKQIDR